MDQVNRKVEGTVYTNVMYNYKFILAYLYQNYVYIMYCMLLLMLFTACVSLIQYY